MRHFADDKSVRRASSRILISVSVAFILGLSGSANARSVGVVFEHRTVRVDADRYNGVDYVDLRELLDAFNARLEWDGTAQRLRADLDGRLWVFWGHSALVSIDGEVGGLGDPVVVDDDRLMAPLRTLALLLTEFSGMSARIIEGDLHVRHREFSLLGYDIEQRTNGTLIDLRLTGQPPYEVFLSEGNYINLTLHRTLVNPSALNARAPHRLVREVRAVQFDSSAQISFRMRDPFDKYAVSRGEAPGRLTILVGDDAVTPDWAAVPPAPVFDNRIGGVDRIVIDAGHGGADRGAESLDGVTAEKDITLAIAKRLADRLHEDRRFDVINTREGDYDVPDGERIRLASLSDADLLVSIHTTNFPSDAGRGFQTYFYGTPLNDRARLVMADMNASTPRSDAFDDDSDHDSAQSFGFDHQRASAELARLIQSQLEESLSIPSRGVDQGQFRLLDRVDLPAVIVCVASVASIGDEEYLRKRSFHKDVADAIHEAIIEYRRKVTTGPVSLGD